MRCFSLINWKTIPKISEKYYNHGIGVLAHAEMAELADAPDLGSGILTDVGVQLPLSAPFLIQIAE